MNTPLPEFGYLREKQIVAPNGVFPVSRARWWLGVKSGEYPRPIKLAQNVTAWRVEDIRDLIERTERQSKKFEAADAKRREKRAATIRARREAAEAAA